MKKLSVIVKEKTILELAEDGVKGDLIDLKELTQVDSSLIQVRIRSMKLSFLNLKSVLMPKKLLRLKS